MGSRCAGAPVARAAERIIRGMDMARVSACSFPLRRRPLEYTLDVIAGAGFRKVDLLGVDGALPA